MFYLPGGPRVGRVLHRNSGVTEAVTVSGTRLLASRRHFLLQIFFDSGDDSKHRRGVRISRLIEVFVFFSSKRSVA